MECAEGCHNNVDIIQKYSLMRLYECGPWGRNGAVMTRSFNYVDVCVLKVLGSFWNTARCRRSQFKISFQVSDGDKAAERESTLKRTDCMA